MASPDFRCIFASPGGAAAAAAGGLLLPIPGLLPLYATPLPSPVAAAIAAGMRSSQAPQQQQQPGSAAQAAGGGSQALPALAWPAFHGASPGGEEAEQCQCMQPMCPAVLAQPLGRVPV